MRIEDTGKIYKTYFESWGEFVDQAEFGNSTAPENCRKSKTNGSWFSAGANFEESIQLARTGWPEGLARMKTKLDTLKAAIPSRFFQPVIHMQVVGPGTLDMNRYQMGHPEPWVTWQQEQVESQDNGIIIINFNISASAGVSSEEMFQKGAACCELVDILESQGRRVELMVSMGNQGIQQYIMVKRAGDILDMDRIAFATAHAGSFRRLGFSHLEQAPDRYMMDTGVYPNYGYGRPADIEVEGALNIKPSSWYDRSYIELGSVKWLNKQLEQYGIILEV